MLLESPVGFIAAEADVHLISCLEYDEFNLSGGVRADHIDGIRCGQKI